MLVLLFLTWTNALLKTFVLRVNSCKLPLNSKSKKVCHKRKAVSSASIVVANGVQRRKVNLLPKSLRKTLLLN